jgi:hypothetical protein
MTERAHNDAESIFKSYVSGILRLALLAPDIVEAILASRTDQALMLEGWRAGAAAAGSPAVTTAGAARRVNQRIL